MGAGSFARGLWLGVACAAVSLLFAALSPVPASTAPPPVVGFGANHQWNTPSSPMDLEDVEDVRREDVLAAAAGGKVLRVIVGWNRIQRDGPNSYHEDWVERLDDVTSLAASENLKIVALVVRTPCWASSTPFKVLDTCLDQDHFFRYPPTYSATFGRFVEWLTDEVGEHLAAVEVWNEPNYGGESLLGPDPEAGYVGMVARAKARATNGVPIWAGSLHNRGDLGNPSTSGPAWADKLLTMRIDDHIDAWSLHTYGGGGSPQAMVDQVEGYRDLFLDHDAGEIPFAITEFGWRTFLGPDNAQPVTEQEQANRLVAALEAFGELDYVTHALVFHLRDLSTHNQWAEGFGVLHEDFCEKPAYGALQDLLGGVPAEEQFCPAQ